MSSQIARVTGGGFGKENRFPIGSQSGSPGPMYKLPSAFSEHIQGHIYKQNNNSSRSGRRSDLPHPTKDRTAWVIGSVKGGMAYYNDVVPHGGPANYNQDVKALKPSSPKNAFTKTARFGEGSRTKQFVSHDHNRTNLCTESQGPKYLPKRHAMDFKAKTGPAYSFGGKGVSERSGFINKQVKGGYLYECKPATSNKDSNVDAATYSPNYKNIKNRSPRAQWGKADRFAKQEKEFISPKAQRAKIGLNSPGPMYRPMNFDTAALKKTATATQAGKWCP